MWKRPVPQDSDQCSSPREGYLQTKEEPLRAEDVTLYEALEVNLITARKWG